MTNIERQKSLDKKKWDESKMNLCDMSGYMAWCDYCTKQAYDTEKGGCEASQAEREEQTLCAKAYNRMRR